jgi:signal transduction histidine kinase
MKNEQKLKSKVHKTKSSITVISGYLQMLSANINKSDDSEFIEKNQKLVQKASDSCTSLLDQILNIEEDLD